MTKIDIFSGFLGAGKTTLIKKLINEAYKGEKLVLIENEFGEIGIDGGFLKDAGIEITEMNSGCICCSLVGDFSEALKKVIDELNPERILIEPSGVGKLSDVIKAVKSTDSEDICLNSFTTVVDAKKCKVYMKNFGEFYNDQLENAGCIVLSHTTGISNEKTNECIQLIRGKNTEAEIVSTPWDELDGKRILEAMEGANTLADTLSALVSEHEICPECGEHHHGHCDHDHEHSEENYHHHHDEEHCEHEHERDDHCCCSHEHHHNHCDHDHKHSEENHHHHDEENCEHEHEHDDHCCCGHEHHHHHADDVFASWGAETTLKYSEEKIRAALEELGNSEKFGIILRAKGIVSAEDGKWIHFDYIPGEADIRFGAADIIGRLCVIGSNINKAAIEGLFSAVEKK